MKLPLLVLLLLTLLLTGRPASAQTPPPTAADSLALRVAAHTAYLTDAMRLSPRQRPGVAALLRQHLAQPARPVSREAWLRVLTLRQYQAWQLYDGAPGGPGPLLAARPE